jgi:hypothetical protein
MVTARIDRIRYTSQRDDALALSVLVPPSLLRRAARLEVARGLLP